MPAAESGTSTAALGGSQLAVNRNAEHPEAAWAVIEYLTRPEQMLERARVVGQFPTRPAVYDMPEHAAALSIPPADAGHRARRARPTRSTPSSRDPPDPPAPRAHLPARLGGRAAEAQREMQRLLDRAGLGEGGSCAR
jgi:ABC-type glycerol-3-phosphate transport system substrate-binding protein